MADYLLDTNIILRLHDGASPDQPVAQKAILKLRLGHHRIYLTAQNLIEFWAVVTRPVAVNG